MIVLHARRVWLKSRRRPRPGRRRRRDWIGLGVVAVSGLVACQANLKAPAPDIHSPLIPLSSHATHAPSRADQAAADLAEATLASRPEEMKYSLNRVALTRPQWEPLGHDLINSTLDDPEAYRRASQDLLDRGTDDPLLEKRLEQAIREDHLKQADKHIFDHRHKLFARTFNAISEPLGNSVLTGMAIAPYKLAMSAVRWAVTMLETDPLTLEERKALALRKQFLAGHPRHEQAAMVRQQISDAEQDLRRTRSRHYARDASMALESDQHRLAAAYADRALQEVPSHGRADRISQHAKARVRRTRRLHRRSVETTAALPDELSEESPATEPRMLEPDMDAEMSRLATQRPALIRQVSESVLLPNSDLSHSADLLEAADSSGELHDEAAFLRGVALHETGNEGEEWRQFDALAHRDPSKSNMARHAAAMVNDPWQNPYGFFLSERSRQRQSATAWYLFGNIRVPRYNALPHPTGYLFVLPSMAQALATSPIRNLLAVTGASSNRPNFERGMSIAAYRYLARYPDGVYSREMIAWLYEYQEGQENWRAALRLADFQPGFDPAKRRELVEKAGQQAVRSAQSARRRDLRGSLLRNVVREYPDSEAGRAAGLIARNTVTEAAGQRIRMTRSFLYENPAVAGSEGLGIRSEFLDEDLDNGELHPEGVTFLGGNLVEFAFVDASGDEDAAPVPIRRRISNERLGQSVAVLEETAFHNARMDEGASVGPDALRDIFFERARLGLTQTPDLRPNAQSTYVYQSLRERYGMVRGRDSILPFDLVLQGSVDDLSLGAFPRWREPLEGKDAYLFR